MQLTKKSVGLLLLVSILALSFGVVGCGSDQAEEDAAAAKATAQEAMTKAEAAEEAAAAAETAAEEAATSVVTAREGALAIEPNVVDPSVTTSVMIYGSGFLPNKTVDLFLLGTWTFKGGEMADPAIDARIANEYGAFSTSVSISKLVSNFGLGSGIYTIKAVQGDGRVASACLVVQ